MMYSSHIQSGRVCWMDGAEQGTDEVIEWCGTGPPLDEAVLLFACFTPLSILLKCSEPYPFHMLHSFLLLSLLHWLA